MTKEDMIDILNQHGIDVLYDVISNDIKLASSKEYDRGYRLGYRDGLDNSWCRYIVCDE